MKLIQFTVMLATALFSNTLLAGVYKCTDAEGNTSYQSSPCAKENKAVEINIQTGGSTDLSDKDQQKTKDLELEKQQKKELENKLALEAKLKKDTAEQSALNQQLIKNNPIQYTAFAIPPYIIGKLPELVKPYESRLPEIEKNRRLAAQKALATGECIRVESDELSAKSKPDNIVISIDCSSAKTFYYSEAELSK
jgi:hypothetical protein